MPTPGLAKVLLEELMRTPHDDGAGSFDVAALHTLRDIRESPGQVDCSFLVTKENRYGTLHGGCIATIVDRVGTTALVTLADKTGVSQGISVDYLTPQPGGELVDISAKVIKAGKLIAHVTVEFRNRKTKKLIAIGRQAFEIFAGD